MTEQNEADFQIKVEFEGHSTETVVYQTVVRGLDPELTVRAEHDEDTNEVTLKVDVFGVDRASELIETAIEVLQHLLPSVLEKEQENAAAEESVDAEPRQDQ